MQELTPDGACQWVRDADTLAVPLGPGQPVEFLHALGKRERFDRLDVFGALLVDAFALFTRPGVALQSGFYGPVERALRDAGHAVRFVPADFRRFARIARRMAPRVMATAAAPPDRDGFCSLSLHAGATVDELLRCGRDPDRVLIVEANPRLPRTLGLPPAHPHAIHTHDIDVLIHSEREPVALPDTAPSDIERAIAAHAVAFVPDGATLQTGIGGIADAVARTLAEGSGGNYGIHSEMFTTGLMHLHRSGKATNRRKGLHDGVSICTFAMGTRALYDWLGGEGRELVRFLPVDEVNDPAIIARNRALVSINGALSVDLYGQVVADQIGGRQYSGIGGHEEFVAGAAFSEGGRSLICLPSQARGAHGAVSRIVPAFPPGACITTPRHQVDAVITEYGVAELAGKTNDARR
ncbi:MAG TPA: acetyl-CoA hydrolase/transferase C-terminal domain-containing protein, partial [Myxococcota bacterium]|nr:acetyl-CoA hydrolase/transferase C-terminal domain-containing protein [Myxococcota bacterium]